jgi:hypothetical protein
MQATLDDSYVVMVREWDPNTKNAVAVRERELATFPTYEQALWVKKECTGPRRTCVIRYLGPAGGGD